MLGFRGRLVMAGSASLAPLSFKALVVGFWNLWCHSELKSSANFVALALTH